ncbi:unnamed protein product [Gordionus sp. m RMFG-2023]
MKTIFKFMYYVIPFMAIHNIVAEPQQVKNDSNEEPVFFDSYNFTGSKINQCEFVNDIPYFGIKCTDAEYFDQIANISRLIFKNLLRAFPNFTLIFMESAKSFEFYNQYQLLYCIKFILGAPRLFRQLVCPLPDLFPDLASLTSYNFTNGTFLEGLPLTFLDLSFSEITYLCDTTFISPFYSKLKMLILSDNKLKFLPLNLFSSLNNLVALYINRNYIQSFESNVMRKLVNLEIFSLNTNPIKFISMRKEDLGSMNKFISLSLCNISLKVEQLEALYIPPSVKLFKFSHNKIALVPEPLLAFLTTHENSTIQLQGNPIMCLNMNGKYFDWFAKNKNRQLLFLLLGDIGSFTNDARCYIPQLYKGAFLVNMSLDKISNNDVSTCYVEIPCACYVDNNIPVIYCAFATYSYLRNNSKLNNGRWSNPIILGSSWLLHIIQIFLRLIMCKK